MRAWLIVLQAQAVLLGIDLGNEFTKVCLVRPGKPFEIVHNLHSKRKTPTAISFMQETRAFGDDAIADQGKKPTHVPMFFPAIAGKTDGATGLPQKYYPYNLEASGRGPTEYNIGEVERNMSQIGAEELIGHFVDWTKMLAETAAAEDGANIQIREAALTVPSDISYAERMARMDALEIAGINKPYLVRELGGAAVQRGLDIFWEGNGTDVHNASFVTLFINVGSTKAEACAVKFSPVKLAAGMSSHIEILGCGIEHGFGGHYLDLALSDKAVDAFVEKFPKFGGVQSHSRALRKVIKQAAKTKETLSANVQSRFQVEGLYEDTDFGFKVQRDELEVLFPDTKARLEKPIMTALSRANETLLSISSVQVVGGGSRSPLVANALDQIVNGPRKEADESPLELGRNLNGDEAMALGSAFVVANLSTHFRVKQLWYSDVSEYDYRLRVSPLDPDQLALVPPPDKGKDDAEDAEPTWEGWRRDVTFKAGTKYPIARPVRIRAPFDLKFEISENGNLIQEVHVKLFEERNQLLEKGKYNLTSPLPTINFLFGMGPTGIPAVGEIEAQLFYSAEHITYKKKVKDEDEKPTETTADEKEGEDKVEEDQEEEKEEKEEKEEQEEEKEEKKENEEKETTDEEKAEDDSVDSTDVAADANATNATNDTNDTAPNFEPIVSYKKKKVKVSIKVGGIPQPVRSMSPDELTAAKARLGVMRDQDLYVQALDGARNKLESNIYMVREKTEDEAVVAVSTEAELESLRALASETEDWLSENGYEAETTVDLLENKSASLEGTMNRLRGRALEAEHRPLIAERVVSLLEYVDETIVFVKENRTWVTEEQIERLTNETSRFNVWWTNATAEQALKEATEDPAYGVNDVARRLDTIKKEADRLLRIQFIPKPVTPPPSPYDDMFKGSNYSKEWFDALKKNLSNSSYGGMNLSDLNFSGMNFSDMNTSAGDAEPAADAAEPVADSDASTEEGESSEDASESEL